MTTSSLHDKEYYFICLFENIQQQKKRQQLTCLKMGGYKKS